MRWDGWWHASTDLYFAPAPPASLDLQVLAYFSRSLNEHTNIPTHEHTNIPANEHTNTYFKCNKRLKLSNELIFKFQTTFFNNYTPIFMKKLRRVCLLIIKYGIRGITLKKIGSTVSGRSARVSAGADLINQLQRCWFAHLIFFF